MSIQTINDPGEPYATQRVSGALVVEEVIAAQRRLYLRPDHDPCRPVLWDTREVGIRTDFNHVFRMVEESTGMWPKMAGGRTAILVAESRFAPMARLYKKLAEAMPRQLAVFTSHEQAVSWLQSDQPGVASKAS